MSNSKTKVCSWPRCSCKATGLYCKDKPASGPKAKKHIPRQSAKGRVKAIEKGMLRKNDAAIYLEIWQQREHRDFQTCLPICGEILTLYFHHVLPKRPDGGYPQYRHCKWNIILVSWETHQKAENDLDLVPVIKAYYEKLLALHNAGKLAHADPEKHQL